MSESRRTLARECESGSRLSHAEASRKVRGLRRSSPTRNELRRTDSAHPGHWRGRFSLLIGRTRRRVRLHRGHGAGWHCSRDHSTDRPGAEHFCRDNRQLSILAGRLLVMAAFLALRGAFDSGRISGWLLAVVGQRFPHPARSNPAILSGASDLSTERFASRRAALHSGGARRWRRHRASFRADWNRRGHFSDSLVARLPMGAHPAGRRGIGLVHPGQLDRRSRGLPERELTAFLHSLSCWRQS